MAKDKPAAPKLGRHKSAMTLDGKRVVCATEKVSLHITDADIQAGKALDPEECAAALCIKRTIADVRRCCVYRGMTYLEFGNKWLRYKTPGSLRSEIIAFDRGGKFYPTAHTLAPLSKTQRARYGKRVPDKGRKLGTKREREGGRQPPAVRVFRGHP